ncbi:DUF773 domain-containing protein [Leptospira gomenensis]|uniref:DUF773 domain-containing protein n=1 Tax=Leptospira gomenensis TaxID=2484974 RepID=A0A5F1Y6S0_9LEPT|nr:DUF773 domain-containing protein [Leptospira gomenensis]TGK28994.1 DUF773 domain-containing protein [Leptospira gomenensis]TGK32817.1 DUF773 domain-containing protein [Leptospira gomenensis]TGK40753.1 DUF773 domain-containing protein [Leptospira gomenensis]TGK68403.1 DUF773 domain-containing protein [Leptospira gomenensis]
MSKTEFEILQETFLAKQNDTTSGKWFGLYSLNLNGKPFAASYEGQLVLKLGAETISALVSRYPGSKLFDPSGMNRAMKDWLQIPEEFSGDWLELAQKALVFASSGVLQADTKANVGKKFSETSRKTIRKKNSAAAKKKTLQKKKYVNVPVSKPNSGTAPKKKIGIVPKKNAGTASKRKAVKKKAAPKKKRK